MDAGRARILTRRRLVLLLAVLIAAAALTGTFVWRRSMAAWAVRRAFATAGMHPVRFTVRSLGFDSIALEDLSIGDAPWLTAERVIATFSPGDLAAGRVGTITIEDGAWTIHLDGDRVAWGPDPSPNAAPPRIDLPCDRVNLRRVWLALAPSAASSSLGPMRVGVTGSLVRVLADGATHIDAQLVTENLTGAAAQATFGLPRAELDAHVTAPAAAGQDAVVSLALRTASPLTLASAANGITGSIGSIRAEGRLAAGVAGLSALSGVIVLAGCALQAGDLEFTDTEIALTARSLSEVEVSTFRAALGDGGALSAAPFTIDPAAPRPRTELTVTNLSLEEWMPLVTAGHASAEGRVSGRLDVGLDLTGPAPRVTHLTGALASDPSHGFLQIHDADALGAMLDEQDPRFATDPFMRPVRDRIVAALRDFAFKQLSVNLERRAGRTYAPAYISGFGRHGADPQGINLTLDIQAEDAWLDLFRRIATQSRMRAAAADALDQFFSGTPENGP